MDKSLKKQPHPLAFMMSEEDLARTERRLRIGEIERQVAQTTREIALAAPLTIEEQALTAAAFRKSPCCSAA